jgi:hypothetical protein
MERRRPVGWMVGRGGCQGGWVTGGDGCWRTGDGRTPCGSCWPAEVGCWPKELEDAGQRRAVGGVGCSRAGEMLRRELGQRRAARLCEGNVGGWVTGDGRMGAPER